MRRILLSRTDRIGDVILALPVAQVLKENIPDSEISFLLSSYTCQILENYPYIDRLIPVSGRENILEFVNIFKREKPDILIFVFPVLKLAFAAFLARVPLRIGTAFRTYSFLFNKRLWENRRPSVRHESEYNLSMIRPLGVNISKVPPPRLFLTGEEKIMGENVLSEFPRPRVIIHPGGVTHVERNWPSENYILLADRLKATGASIIFTGNKSEGENLSGLIKGQHLNLMGKLPLRQLLGVIAASDLLVSASTGPMHMAAALGIPTLSFFVPLRRHHPRRWHPLGNRHIVLLSDEKICQKYCNKWDHFPCMSLISVDEVIEKTLYLLKDKESEDRCQKTIGK